MAYRFEPGVSIENETHRIAAEEVQYATTVLSTCRTAKQRDKAIHEARKSLKKLRGLLRLFRPVLDSVYRGENQALRDIGRNLSELRDAGAIIETFDQLVKDHLAEFDTQSLSVIRNSLKRKKAQKEHDLDVPKVLSTAAATLTEFGHRASHWDLNKDGLGALAPGLTATYRAGRKAMRKAENSKDPVLYHDWRKRAKDHWYHVRLLPSLWTDSGESREDSLHDLESALGEDHNLDVLCAVLASEPELFAGKSAVDAVTSAARKQQRKLRKDALDLGASLYSDKPREFAEKLESAWETWQEEAAEVAV